MPKTFLLSMLGTGTEYTPTLKNQGTPNPGYYPKGELLSIISSLVLTEEQPQINPKSVSPLTADEVQVINGPSNLGSEVGDRIGRGVAAIMKAITRGQTTINIIAHSRGAVESLIISHEIQEIQKVIRYCANLDTLIKYLGDEETARRKANTSSTNTIIDALRSELAQVKDKEAFFQALKHNIPDVSINFFGIDPVPGDVAYGITWYDDRFYTVPPIVKNTRIMYYENERSNWGFTPINVDATDPAAQLVEKFAIKGHHGTGSSGNNLSQQSEKVSPEGKKTTHVQKLMIFMLLEFLEKHGVAFKNLDIFDEGHALGRKSMDQAHDFDSIYLELYGKISENLEAYEAYNNTHYTAMGLLRDDRRIMRRGNYEQFRTIFPAMQGYINDHHGQLMQNLFCKKLGLNSIEQDTLDQVVAKVHHLLLEYIRAKDNPGSLNLTRSLATTSKLIFKEPVQQDFIVAFQGLINRINQKYLTGDWSSDEKQKEKIALFREIKSLMSVLLGLSKDQNANINLFVNQLILSIFAGIKETIKQQYTDMQGDLSRTNRSLDEELNLFFNELLLQLEPGQSDEPRDIAALISNVFKSQEFTALPAHGLDQKIKFIWANITEQFPERTNEYSVEKIKTLFDEQYGANFEDFERLYNRLQIFIADIEALSELSDAFGELPDKLNAFFEHHELHLRRSVDVLINNTARRFYNERSLKTLSVVQDSFRQLVERCAIKNYGARDPLTVLKEELNSTNQAKDLFLIEDLETLTTDYLVYLKTTNAGDSDEQRESLDIKKLIVEDLLHTLSSDSDPFPSNRVRNFYKKLDESEIDLAKHRDSAWKRFVKAALIIGGILISGILPGLAALAIYTNTGKTASKSFMFWKSDGENWTEELKSRSPQFDESDEECTTTPGV